MIGTLMGEGCMVNYLNGYFCIMAIKNKRTVSTKYT